MSPRFPEEQVEHWLIRKPAVRSARGVVAAQNAEAAAVGAEVLAAGGNAIDAAVATALALGVVEPWMNGLGGGGYAMIWLAKERRAVTVDFAMLAPKRLDPADYPLVRSAAAQSGDAAMFGWPAVEDDRNLVGHLSIAVPGAVAGYAECLQRFGTLAWADALAPAIRLAERGVAVQWWTAMNVTASQPGLARYPGSRAVYLPGGYPPVPVAEQAIRHLSMGALPATLRRLAEAGPRDFYEGEIAAALLKDLRAGGNRMTADDLKSYRAVVAEPLALARGEAVYHLPKGLTAAPTFAHALGAIPAAFDGGEPDAAAYAAYAKALAEAYRVRLETLGHAGDDAGDPRRETCTTHLSAADADGNLVALTTTLLSRFGSCVVLPGTGVLMNNGINWFDTRPGRPNAIAPGAKMLSNMTPVVASRGGRPWLALGASGGRKIMPAIFQILSFMSDFGMGLEDALHHPRIDASGPAAVSVDPRLPRAVRDAVARAVGKADVPAVQMTAFPASYASPQAAMLEEDGGCLGLAHPWLPVAAAVGA